MSANDHQYALNWSNHTLHLKKAFDSLLAGNEFVDVTLSCEGKKISAHKMLLSACSTYFHDLFRDNPCQHPIVILKDVKFQNLVDLLTFMYSGEVSVPTENFDSFLKTAELLHISGLTDDQNRTIDTESEGEHREPKNKRELSEHTRAVLKRRTETAREKPETSTDTRNDSANTSEEKVNKRQKTDLDSTTIMEIKQEQVEALNIEHEEFTSDDPLHVDNMDLLQPSGSQKFAEVQDLLNETSNRARRSKESDDDPLKLAARHFLSVVSQTHAQGPSTRRRCYVCSHTLTRPRRRKNTKYVCNHCGVPMCKYPCFEEYHSNFPI